MCPERTPHRLAGAPGFEPGNGGIKIRCLTTWLRPIARADHTGASGAEQRLGAGGIRDAAGPQVGAAAVRLSLDLEHGEPRDRDDHRDRDECRSHLKTETVDKAMAMMLAVHCHWTSPSRNADIGAKGLDCLRSGVQLPHVYNFSRSNAVRF